MRVFKNKWFNNWAVKEGISENALLDAAEEIVAGKVEANLGSYLFKKRLARQGGGKRGGYRTIVGFRRPNSERIIFLYAFAKKDRSTISMKEEAALSLAAGALLFASDEQVQSLISAGAICEVLRNE